MWSPFTFVLIPYQLIRGIIDPKLAVGRFPFDSPEDKMMSRAGFLVILLLGYAVPLDGALHFLLAD